MTIKDRYKTALEFMYEQLPMFQRQGKTAFKKDLKNIIKLCKSIDDPQNNYSSIHVAGTNGKGSVSHAIASVLQDYGFKVGLYTSPHYKDFRERIKINGELISKLAVVEFIDEISESINEIRPSFFELTVAMAFNHFAEQRVDIAIVETGLGGRLDSTNIITPILSVITNISLDHTDMLGNTLAEIATEKAGIIKSGVPVIIGEKSSETNAVFENRASLLNSPLTYAENVSPCLINENQVECQVNGKKFAFKPKLISPFLAKNSSTALAALLELNKLGYITFDRDKVRSSLELIKENTYYIGRWEVLGEEPQIIADSAHNEAGLQLVLDKIDSLSFAKIHFVLGFVKDKSIDSILRRFPVNANYYFVKADIPRGLDAKILKKTADNYDLVGRAYSSVKNGLRAAKRNANPKDLIYVGGSIFVVGEIL